jgi:hypothetical protein
MYMHWRRKRLIITCRTLSQIEICMFLRYSKSPLSSCRNGTSILDYKTRKVRVLANGEVVTPVVENFIKSA